MGVKNIGVKVLRDFPSEYEKVLNALFTRELVKRREIPKDKRVIISPVDALVTDFGKIEEGKAYSDKGYGITVLLNSFGEFSLKRDFRGS